MPKLKLTDAAARRLSAPKGSRIDFYDATLPAFGLRVSGPTPRRPGGRKNWFYIYRHRRTPKRYTFEPPFPTLGLADARKKVGELIDQLDRDQDPNLEKRARRLARTLGGELGPDSLIDELVDPFIRRHLEGRKRSANYVEGTRKLFDNHVVPRWTGRAIKDIKRRDVTALLDTVADGSNATRKGSKARGGPIVANRVLAAVRELFNWAVDRGIVEATPISRLRPPGKETRRDRVLADEELAELWPAFAALGYPHAQYLQLVLATGQRRTEVATMRWADINEARATWTLPGPATKARRVHLVPLSKLALDIIAQCKAAQDELFEKRGPYVFTTTNEAPISGYTRFRRRLGAAVEAARAKRHAEAAAGSASDDDAAMAPWTIHDLRRTLGTGLGRFGYSRLVIARVLNHADRSVTGIYDRHEYFEEKRAALEQWAQHLLRIAAPPAPDQGATNVVPFAPKAEGA